jgi:Protein of unknown function (DUF2971)
MIYKFCAPSQYALTNLESESLYCRHFEDYNDPFEFWGKLERGLPAADDNNERFRRAIAAWGFPDTKKEDLPLDEDLYIDFFGSLAENAPLFTFENSRICCFCPEISNLLMWSHYADGLRGFCLKFDETALFKPDEHIALVPVIYSDKPPVIDTLVYSVTEDQFEYAVEHGYEEYEGELRRMELNEMLQAAFASKPAEWSYEKEVRLIIQSPQEDKNPMSYKYASNALKSIIIGEKMPADFRLRIANVLTKLKTDITTKIAVRSSQEYRLIIEDIGF